MSEVDLAEPLLHWRSESFAARPRRFMRADDTLTADTAFRLACEGTALLWLGDYQNARQLLAALTRRLDKSLIRRAARAAPVAVADDEAMVFHRHRQRQAHRARVLGMLVIPVTADYEIPLRRAPDLRAALTAAWGRTESHELPKSSDSHEPQSGSESVAVQVDASPPPGYMVSLRELLGIVGAWEWQRKGLEIPALGPPPSNRIHAHYGVFAPLRPEYTELVANALGTDRVRRAVAFDIGTGTGVLAAILARHGVGRVIATENDARSLACAQINLQRLGCLDRVSLMQADLFPDAGEGTGEGASGVPTRAPLIVCNPPWVPARASAPIERAIYDEGSQMLTGFLAGVGARLTDDGQAWLILSDIGERFGLRKRDELLAQFDAAGLRVLDRQDAQPRHPKVGDANDALHAARIGEVVSLWRLVRR